MLENLALWATVFGSLIALLALAWSAVNYVAIRKSEIKHTEYQKFFEIMDHLGQQGGSIASKVAAAYELRKYPEYSDVIIRLFKKVEVDGSSAKMLKDEMALTVKFFKGSR